MDELCAAAVGTGFGYRQCNKPAKWTVRRFSIAFPSTERIPLCGIHVRRKMYRRSGEPPKRLSDSADNGQK